MKPIDFPQANVTWAEHQPEYIPLPSYVDGRETITRWQLTWWERLAILFSGKFWLRQMNFRDRLQPQKPQIEDPFALPITPPATLPRDLEDMVASEL